MSTRVSGEIHHHTYEQVVSILHGAQAAVDEAEPPEDLRQIAFAKAIDLLAAKQIFYEQIASGVLDGLARRG